MLTMLKIVTITIAALALLALPAVATAQDSGLGAYEENVPTPGGDGGDTGTTTEPTGTSTATGVDSGVGTSTGSTGTVADTNGDGTVSEVEAAQVGATPAGQLPATGLDETLLMAIVGAVLLAAGFALKRFTRAPAS